MDIQSSGALLRILNLVAIADGHLAPEEENLLDSLASQYKLQAKIISWQDDLDQPSDIRALALKIASEHHELAYKTATMVANISRARGEDDFVCAQEEQLLNDMAAALQLAPEQIETIRRQADQELNKHPNLWQVLYACFGSQFEPPILI